MTIYIWTTHIHFYIFCCIPTMVVPFHIFSNSPDLPRRCRAVTPKAHVLFRSFALSLCVTRWVGALFTHTCCMATVLAVPLPAHGSQTQNMHARNENTCFASINDVQRRRRRWKKNAENQTTHARTYTRTTSPIYCCYPAGRSFRPVIDAWLCGGRRPLLLHRVVVVVFGDGTSKSRRLVFLTARSQSTHLHRRVKSQNEKNLYRKRRENIQQFVCVRVFPIFVVVFFASPPGRAGVGIFKRSRRESNVNTLTHFRCGAIEDNQKNC